VTFVAVSTAIDALVLVGLAVKMLHGRPSEVSALWPSRGHLTVTKPVGRAAGAPLTAASAPLPGANEARHPDPAFGMESVRQQRDGKREPEEAAPGRLDEVRQDFVADVSHELKTPVGALALLAEAVLDAADDPHQVRRFGNKILREANRLGILVTELIALSRLQSAERLPKLASVDVDDVVRTALERCRLGVESADIKIAVESPSELKVTGDATLLVTALSNLIDNAVSYSPPGSPVSISTRLANGFVEIAVTDQGRGIEPEYQNQVFDRFFRVDQALSRSTGGTGLGLAIVKRVAVNHGGDVELWSRPYVGSTFTLRIPADQHHCTTPRTAQQVVVTQLPQLLAAQTGDQVDRGGDDASTEQVRQQRMAQHGAPDNAASQ
jgi:two-component system, OmpR family, sensor histidine kinase SenX3